MCFSSIESIVAVHRYNGICQGFDTMESAKVSIIWNLPRYRYYGICQGIDTMESAKISILWNLLRYRYYRICQGIDTIESAKVLILSNLPRYWYYRIGIDTSAITTRSSTEESVLLDRQSWRNLNSRLSWETNRFHFPFVTLCKNIIYCLILCLNL